MKTSALISVGVVALMALAVVVATSARVIVVKSSYEVTRPSATETRAVVREVTAYTLGRVEETDDTPCIGASNKDLCKLAEQGIQTCASNEFPFGTRLLVGEIECVVEDRMARKYSDRVDIAMLDRDLALKFGRQELVVIVK